ncbi:MAG: acyl-CoA dehydrogenase family protein, partial [Ilumatobacteraceae bacterium]
CSSPRRGCRSATSSARSVRGGGRRSPRLRRSGSCRARGRCRRSREIAPGAATANAAEEADDYFATYKWYPQRAGRSDLAIPHAQRAGRAGDPVVRQRLADLHALAMTARWTAQRARAAREADKPAGPEGSIGKLVGSEIARRAAALHGDLAGARGMLDGADSPDEPYDAIVAEILVSQPGQSIAGGTDQIQRNIIGERTLGLPREPAVDIDVPFREVRTNTR